MDKIGGIVMTGKTYQCETCGQQVQLSGEIPSATECCGAKWIEVERLPACEMPATAEHSRFDADDEPCDDGRAG
jgi:hypothetical protein